MRRGIWFVLALMGGVPAGALAQQQRQQPAEQSASRQQGASNMATPRNKQVRSCPGTRGRGTGGSGTRPRAQASAGQPGEQIFVGRLRSVSRDRLVMVGPSRRVYEFGVGARTRIIGPRGEAIAPQTLKQGAWVRAVTREAEVRNEVRSLQILGPASAR
ncbi:MAG TPA: hypothetical protein VNA24_07905 [Hyalangium sp.]|nr:hypothetical protein [Hyalangium sp.]